MVVAGWSPGSSLLRRSHCLNGRFGPRKVVSAYGVVSALSTALIPASAGMGFYYLVVMRFLQGTALSVCLNVVAYVTGQWSMLKTNAVFIACLSGFYQFGPIFTMPISGMLCSSSLGWPSVYYVHSAVTVIFFVLFFYFYRDVPHMHRNVSARELGKIQRGKEDILHREPVPYKAILTSSAVWAVWIAAIGNFMGGVLPILYGPTYLNKVVSSLRHVT
uniref:MFS domain-containing protein n=1 Tax=Steinernema glaseri TaxID=37863 RepID=A0A1I8APJ2_9BILA